MHIYKYITSITKIDIANNEIKKSTHILTNGVVRDGVMGLITCKERETCFKEIQILRIRRSITAGSKWNRL